MVNSILSHTNCSVFYFAVFVSLVYDHYLASSLMTDTQKTRARSFLLVTRTIYYRQFIKGYCHFAWSLLFFWTQTFLFDSVFWEIAKIKINRNWFSSAFFLALIVLCNRILRADSNRLCWIFWVTTVNVTNLDYWMSLFSKFICYLVVAGALLNNFNNSLSTTTTMMMTHATRLSVSFYSSNIASYISMLFFTLYFVCMAPKSFYVLKTRFVLNKKGNNKRAEVLNTMIWMSSLNIIFMWHIDQISISIICLCQWYTAVFL